MWYTSCTVASVYHPDSRTAVVRLGSARPTASRLAGLALAFLIPGLAPVGAGAAVTYYVDNQNSFASDANPGTQALPYRTITAAAAAHHGAGNVILVNPGIYRETVTPPASGDSTQPFTYRAVGQGVVVDGSDDFSGRARWALASGTVYLASTVTWSPLQVFVDGERLAASTAAPAALPANSFVYVAGAGLYVNLGGDHPGDHQTTIGRRTYGFRLSNVAWVEVDGFVVAYAEDKAVSLSNTAYCAIRNNIVTQSRKYGIHLANGGGNVIENNRVYDNQFHGIGLVGATQTTVQDNECYRNADPSVRVANGLYLSGATSNLIRRNSWHDNQDSGAQYAAASDDNLSIQNVSWRNGDSGFDCVDSKNSIMIGCVAYGNTTDGFGLNGASTGAQVYDCIGVNNSRNDLSVAFTATAGFQSDYNLFWNSTAQAPFRYGSVSYATVAAFRGVSGTDAQTLQADPKFAGAPAGDFHLLAGSPAIDNGHSGLSAWPPQDAESGDRQDDPATPNTGVGVISYADRGAYEYHPPPNQPPNGTIDTPVSNLTIAAGQAVLFAGSGVDPGNNLPLSFAWSFGGGAAGTTDEDPGPVVFAYPGTYSVTLAVTDALGLADPTPATRVVTVTPAPVGVPNDEIHWTFTGPNSVTIDWRGFDRVVRYGLTTAYGSQAFGATPAPHPISSPGPFQEAKLTGLAENTVYHYSIGSGPDHTFHTPPPRGTPGFTIYAAGDIGCNADFGWMGPMQDVIAADHPAFVLMVGDLTYGNSTSQASVDRHFNDVMVWSQDAAYMPVWGNHDWEHPDRDDLRNYRGRFDLPNPQTAAGSPETGGEDWSWFDYGNVRFISYPEPYDPTSWPEWRTHAVTLMDQAQADPQIRFIVTFGHRPAYSSGYHGGDAIRAHLDGLGATHSKYVLNLNGHSHDYERSYPQYGVTHITAGTGGAELEMGPGPCVWNGGCPPPAWSAFRAMHHVNVRLHFASAGIGIEAICGPPAPDNDISCTPGTIIDSFVIGTLHQAPVVTAPPAAQLDEGGALTLHVSATDPDGFAITSLVAKSLPQGATFTAGPGNTSGTLSWTPSYLQAGTYNVPFIAANALSDTATALIIVRNVEHGPVVSAPAAAAVLEQDPIAISVTAFDPDGEPISSLVATGLPPGAKFISNTSHTGGMVEWTPAIGQDGVYTLHFTAANALSTSATTTLTVRVAGAPVVTAPAAASTPVDSLLTIDVTASDPEHEPVYRFTASGLPAGAGFVAGPGNRTGRLTWRPTGAQAGNYDVSFIAENDRSGSATTRITVGDRPPKVSAPASASVQAGMTLLLNISASDPDGSAIASLSATPLSAAVLTTRNGNTGGTLNWTPTATDAGSHTVTFTAANALSGASSTTITVSPPNLPPIPVVSVSQSSGNAPLEVSVDAGASTDPDGSVSSFRFDFGDGTIVGPRPQGNATHKYAACGNWTLTVTVTDYQGAATIKTIPVTVGWAPHLPNLVGNPSFESGTTNWGPYASATLARVAGGFDGSWALQVTGPATPGTFGINDTPNWVAGIPAAGRRYRITACVRSEEGLGSVKFQVREYLGATKMGEAPSPSVVLSPSWRMVTVDYTSVAAGSNLDFQVLDSPVEDREAFLVDNISIFDITDPNLVDVADLGGRVPLVATVSPSPMRTSSTVMFVTSRPGPLSVTLFDVGGRQVRTLLDEPRAAAGFHVATVDGNDDRGKKLASGLYFFSIQALEGKSSGRIVIAR